MQGFAIKGVRPNGDRVDIGFTWEPNSDQVEIVVGDWLRAGDPPTLTVSKADLEKAGFRLCMEL